MRSFREPPYTKAHPKCQKMCFFFMFFSWFFECFLMDFLYHRRQETRNNFKKCCYFLCFEKCQSAIQRSWTFIFWLFLMKNIALRHYDEGGFSSNSWKSRFFSWNDLNTLKIENSVNAVIGFPLFFRIDWISKILWKWANLNIFEAFLKPDYIFSKILFFFFL